METTNATTMTEIVGGFADVHRRAELGLCRAHLELRRLLHEESAQGTTEYAILVGVLVVIAIAAIVLFRDKVSELWDDIVEGFDSI